jgi:hypothetical protein
VTVRFLALGFSFCGGATSTLPWMNRLAHGVRGSRVGFVGSGLGAQVQGWVARRRRRGRGCLGVGGEPYKVKLSIFPQFWF